MERPPFSPYEAVLKQTLQFLALGAPLAVMVACGDQQQHDLIASGVGEVRVVETPDIRWTDTPTWSISKSPLLEIAPLDSIPATQFSKIAAALRVPSGRIAIADRASQEVRVFDAAGGLMTVIGGPGDAPGSFRDLNGLFRIAGDSIAAFDSGRARLSILDPLGNFVRSQGLRGAIPPGRAIGIAGSSLVVVWNPQGGMNEGLLLDSAAVVAYDLDSGRPDTIGVFPARERFIVTHSGSRTMGMRPFGRELSAAAFGQHIYVGTGATFEVVVLLPNGQADAVIRGPQSRRSVTRQDRQNYVEWRTAGFKAAEAFAARARQVLNSRATPYPSSMPAYNQFLVDPIGNLWVHQYIPPWEKFPNNWVVFDSTGGGLGVIELPSGMKVLQIGEDFLLGIARDTFHVERIQLYELRKSTG